MILTEFARERTDEIDDTLAVHRDFIEAVWDAFVANGQWPLAAELTRVLFGSGIRIDTDQLAGSLPNELVVLDRSAGVIRLHVRALAGIESARRLCELYVAVIRYLVEAYRQPGPDPVIVSSTFESVLAIDSDEAGRLEELCLSEGWSLLAQGGEAGSIRFALDISFALRLADVETVDDYLVAQANAFWPDLQEALEQVPRLEQARQAGAAESSTEASAPASRLHPLIALAAGKLLADGHVREAIDRAAIALQEAVAAHAELAGETGDSLMNKAFNPKGGRLVVADPKTATGQNLQRGTHFLALGAIAAIRNPTSHGLVDPPLDEAMEQLAILSFVARRLEGATLRNDESAPA